MSILPKPAPATPARTADAGRIATVYAVILVILALCQLFTYDHFPELVDSFGLPGGTALAYTLTAVLVTAEVFALPFLLRMPLSPAFRWFSLLCAGLVPAIWLYLTAWLAAMQPAVNNVGLLGTLVEIMPGWWAVFISGALGIMAVWAIWGLWPAQASKKKK
jgi:hypothetical protein